MNWANIDQRTVAFINPGHLVTHTRVLEIHSISESLGDVGMLVVGYLSE